MLRGMTQSLRSQECPACGEYPGVGVFCDACGVLSSHPESGDYAAPYLRRLWGELLDLGLFVLLPLWLAWMWRSANDGQSPAKSLLNMYVIHESGQPITPQRMWVRELVIKRLALGLIGYALSLLGPIINAGWILLNPIASAFTTASSAPSSWSGAKSPRRSNRLAKRALPRPCECRRPRPTARLYQHRTVRLRRP